jgi:hypothetical protein
LIITTNIVGNAVVCVPRVKIKGRFLTQEIVEHAHKILGHKGYAKVLDYIRRWFWWPSVAENVRIFCKSCGKCQTTKAFGKKPMGLLHPLPIPKKPWESTAMDFVGPFPNSEGFDYLMVVIC